MLIKTFYDLGMVSRNFFAGGGVLSQPSMLAQILSQLKQSEGDGIKKSNEDSSGITGQQENGTYLNLIDLYDFLSYIYFIMTTALSI